MEVTLIQPFWYSETLDHLLEVALEARKDNPNSEIILLGNLLNAYPVRRELAKLGIKIAEIPYEHFIEHLNNVPKDTVILTSPYGSSKKLFKALKKKRFVYYDCTSPFVKRKIKFIKKRRIGKKVIYISNPNTIENSYLTYETSHRFYLYDVNKRINENYDIFNEKKFNKKRTYVLYQSELAGNETDRILRLVQHRLPKAQIMDELSDENFKRNQYLNSAVKDGDFIIIASAFEEDDKYILNYYHLGNKKLFYTTIRSVNEAMQINVSNYDGRIFVISDGSVDYNMVNEIYKYFKYQAN